MLLQAALHIFLFLFVAFVAALPFSNPVSDRDHVPQRRFTPEQVEEMRLGQLYQPGYVHTNLTFGNGSGAKTVPLVEADFSLLLDGEGSIQSRDGSSSPPRCSTFTSKKG